VADELIKGIKFIDMILIIAYGNGLRRDDGAGLVLAKG
jgi:hypothetical protein